MNWRNVLERALWTAVQSFIGTISVAELFNVDDQWWVALAVTGVSSALSFIKTVAQERLAALTEG